ncbi:SDR family oxidoreductase [Brevibacillus humidisoli]|uniref:SDR family NAD(P)-dependent oxidoreductase n=1 Tax=Brevibacillus humidisoli TaxID=2895522 RepID=UPI001E30AC0C|nr:SDR family oxidoreductase [Brevibacillus humidisoli]UFJ42374.1 SDR family oxidoreductase [Brevibacillus humidisoli]
MLLSGKVAIVTGSGSGMGKAIARRFREQGAHLVIADIDAAAAEQTASELNGEASPVAVDVADYQQVQQMVEQAASRYGQIDILVNSAGVPMAFTPIEDVTDSQWVRIMNVNVKSIYLTCKHVVPWMKQRGSGAIINIASIAGIRARPGLNAYCASKGAAIMLTRALALELAPHQIRVNAVNPGPADTPMLGKFLSGDAEQVERQTKEIFLNSVPLGRLVEPENIAEACLYLASDLASMVTGEVLNVDGGRGI